jgi:hypothetical protein
MKTYKEWLNESANKPNWSITPWKDDEGYHEPLGMVPLQSKGDVEYRGLIGLITPRKFQYLAAKPTGGLPNVDKLKEEMSKGTPIAPPWLDIEINNGRCVVRGHEGRNRVEAAKQLYGNEPVPIMLYLYIDGSKGTYKNLGPWIRVIEDGLFSEKIEFYIENPFVKLDMGDKVSEYI